MNKQLNIYKPLGKTAVEMIELLRVKYPEYSNVKISYAGRLDPMASGVLILLIGEDENKARREREKSDKEYYFTMLFGIKSDTYDICGIPQKKGKLPKISDLENILPKFTGNIFQKIPIYSAYRVRGKPMYVLASKNELKESDIPTIPREIYKIELKDHRFISGAELLAEVKKRLSLITRGDFRQDKIIDGYEKVVRNKDKFLLVNAYSHVSSGTYIRSLCNDIGEKLGTNCISFEIVRTRSGQYNIKDSIRL